MRYAMTALALLCAGSPAAAQDQAATVAVKQAVERQAVVAAKQAAELQNVRIAVDSKQPKGAPYSAEATTESVQVLADGNRIVTKSGTRIYRDSDGRTRREQLNSAGTDATAINISDPVTGSSFMLDPASHTVYRNSLVFATVGDRVGAMTISRVGPGGITTEMVRTPAAGVALTTTEQQHKEVAEAKAVAEIRTRVASGGGEAGAVRVEGTTTFAVVPDAGAVHTAVMLPRTAEGVGKVTTEDLGQQTIEGVAATGTRTTTEIPAGAIGNEQPIKIVSEQWFSHELQVLVLTKHSDPRVGETTYRLTGIVRAEPASSLFDVPPEYTLHESVIRRQEER